MSKQHAIIPHYFTSSQSIDPAIIRKKSYYVRTDELADLKAKNRIHPFGDSGKLWQWVEWSFTHSHKRVEKGRLSLEIPKHVSDVMAAEMAMRPSWDMA